MSWEQRLREMILAGGALAVAACGGSSSQENDTDCGPIYNTTPDPCIVPCGQGADAASCVACNECVGSFDNSSGTCTPGGFIPGASGDAEAGEADAVDAAPVDAEARPGDAALTDAEAGPTDASAGDAADAAGE